MQTTVSPLLGLFSVALVAADRTSVPLATNELINRVRLAYNSVITAIGH